MTICSDKA